MEGLRTPIGDISATAGHGTDFTTVDDFSECLQATAKKSVWCTANPETSLLGQGHQFTACLKGAG